MCRCLQIVDEPCILGRQGRCLLIFYQPWRSERSCAIHTMGGMCFQLSPNVVACVSMKHLNEGRGRASQVVRVNDKISRQLSQNNGFEPQCPLTMRWGSIPLLSDNSEVHAQLWSMCFGKLDRLCACGLASQWSTWTIHYSWNHPQVWIKWGGTIRVSTVSTSVFAAVIWVCVCARARIHLYIYTYAYMVVAWYHAIVAMSF